MAGHGRGAQQSQVEAAASGGGEPQKAGDGSFAVFESSNPGWTFPEIGKEPSTIRRVLVVRPQRAGRGQ